MNGHVLTLSANFKLYEVVTLDMTSRYTMGSKAIAKLYALIAI